MRASASPAAPLLMTPADRSLCQPSRAVKTRSSHGFGGDREAPPYAAAHELLATAPHRCDDDSGRQRRLKLANQRLGTSEQVLVLRHDKGGARHHSGPGPLSWAGARVR